MRPKQLEFVEKTRLPLMYRLGYIVNAYRDPLIFEIETKFDLTRPEWHILMCLSEVGSISSSEVCQILGHPKNSVARGVSLLEKKGYVLRLQNSKDARVRNLELTHAGRSLFEELEPLLLEQEAKLSEALAKQDRRSLIAKLDKILEVVTRPIG